MGMGTWAPDFRLFDRWGADLGRLSGVTAASWEQQVGGEDTLVVECLSDVPKGTRVVWCDWAGRWHEHVADEPVATRSEGAPAWRVECRTSLCELALYHVEDRRPSGSAALALASALEGTRWEVGSTGGLGALASSVQLYRESALDAVKELAEALGGELWASFEVGDSGVTRRLLNCEAAMGPGDRGRRFEYRRDLAGVTRTVASGEVYTALRGYGRGEAVGDGYGRRLTFASANGGVDWVGDEEARQQWGMPDGSGGKLHAFGTVTFDDCEDPSELLRLTRARLEQVKRPQVSYDCDVSGASAAGLDAADVELGETVAVVDPCFSPALRASGRVRRCEWDLLDPSSSRVTVGDVVSGVTDGLGQLGSRVESMGSQSAAWQAASSGAQDYVRLFLSQLNSMSEQSMSYVVNTPELGVMVANVPLDEATGAPLGTTSGALRCINLRAGALRVASEFSGGAWQWRTAATGEGIVADQITSGTLNADLIRAGVIRDAAGLNWWDMTTGEFSLQGYDPASVPSSVDVEWAVSTSREQAPTTGWSTDAPSGVARGSYVWQRTVVTDASGAVSYGEPACVQGFDGRDGADGTGVTIRGSLDSASQLPASGAEGDAWLVGGDMWVWAGSGWDNVGRIQGPAGQDGTTYYVHLAYANSADGRTDFSTTDPDRSYMGQCVDSNAADPTTPSSYAWSLIRGRDGADGAPGPAGRDGEANYFHVAYATSSDGSQGFSTTVATGKAYIGTYVDGSPSDSQSPSRYAWARFRGQDGSDGLPGVDGADGVTYYLHRAYANNATGTSGFSTTYADGKTYMGTCVNTTLPDPTTPSSYTWARFRGVDGADGADGSDGRGVQSIVEQWYLSTSSTSQVGGSWSTAQPAWAKGRYYWTRSLVFWDDGTVSYTAPVLASGVNGANQAVSDLDDSLTQQEVFDRLTGGGASQGIYLSGGRLYLNGSYINAGTINASRIKAGTLSDAAGRNYWNLSTGEFSLSSTAPAGSYYGTCSTAAATAAKVVSCPEMESLEDGATVMVRWSYGNTAASPTVNVNGTGAKPLKIYGSAMSGSTYYDPVGGATSLLLYKDGAWNVVDGGALYRASSAVREARALDDSLTQQEIFNRLTNDGQTQGIYLSGGKVYINGDYIQAGTVVAKRLGNTSTNYAEVGAVSVPGYASTNGILVRNEGRSAFGIAHSSANGPLLGISAADSSGNLKNVMTAFDRNTYLYTPTYTSGAPARTALILSDGTGFTVNVAKSASELLTLQLNSSGLTIQRYLNGQITTRNVASF